LKKAIARDAKSGKEYGKRWSGRSTPINADWSQFAFHLRLSAFIGGFLLSLRIPVMSFVSTCIKVFALPLGVLGVLGG
jgi:hypothetical protein